MCLQVNIRHVEYRNNLIHFFGFLSRPFRDYLNPNKPMKLILKHCYIFACLCLQIYAGRYIGKEIFC